MKIMSQSANNTYRCLVFLTILPNFVEENITIIVCLSRAYAKIPTGRQRHQQHSKIAFYAGTKQQITTKWKNPFGRH